MGSIPFFLAAIWLQLSLQTKTAQTPTHIGGSAMGMEYSITLGTVSTKDALSRVSEIAQITFAEVDRHLNRWNTASELSHFNRLCPNQNCELSPQLHQVLKIADRAAKISNGRFDPTVEPVCALWKTALNKGHLPDGHALSNLRARIGWSHLSLHAHNMASKRAAIEIDLGGIAKGYCVDLIAERLIKATIENFFIDWGGEVRVHGQHPRGRAWKIGIRSPSENNQEIDPLIDVVWAKDAALATSGSDKQVWTLVNADSQSVCYTHIIDPKTLQALQLPSKRPVTCCVLAKSCAWADALATAGMLFDDIDSAALWFKKLPSDECYCAWIADNDQRQKVILTRCPD